MDRLKKATLLTMLTQQLRENGSWCGETHLQKAVYFLEKLLEVPMGFKYILYKHGPFSFDLRDELTSLRADDLLELLPQPQPYGPKLVPTEQSEYLKGLYPKTLESYSERINFVAKEFGEKGVTELERLATALYITKLKEPEEATIEERADAIVRLKPHVSLETAHEAVKDVDRMKESVHTLLN